MVTLRGIAHVGGDDWSSNRLREFMPHQFDAYQWAIGRPGIALFMEMRLGKTMVAIRWAQARAAKRILVLAPLSTLASWRDELRAEGFPPEAIVFVLGSRERRLAAVSTQAGTWFLLNYEGLRSLPVIANEPWDCVICDESTRIRSPRAQITRIVTKQFQHVPNRAILSGLPAPESPLDYFTQFEFTQGNFMGYPSYWAYRHGLFYAYRGTFEWTPKAGVASRIKTEVQNSAFCLTRKQAGIGSKKIYERRVVPMNTEQSKMFREVEKKFAATLTSGERIETKWAIVQTAWLARLSGGMDPTPSLISDTKLKELKELLTGELKNEPVVVWFRFNAEIDAALRYLDGTRKCAVINGATPVDRRFQYGDQFRSGTIDTLLLQVKCGRFGLDYSNASTAIYYSNNYEAEDRHQSEDRILHPKKTEPLLYIDLVTENSIDEDVLSLLRNKRVTSQYFMMKLLESRYGFTGQLH